MPLDYNDSETVKVFRERNEIENRTRVQWFLRNQEEEIARAQFSEHHHQRTENDISRLNVEHSIPALVSQHEENNTHRRQKPKEETHLNPFTEKRENDEPIMRPVEPEVSGLHHKPLSSGGGRKAYLSTRSRKMPEDKYNSCQTSNVYGWKLHDTEITFEPSKHPKVATFINDVYRLSGAHPDPRHYNPPVEHMYMKCKVSE
ncbi:unnamed protein product [Chrysodeixis includens]|uniref:Sperm microtubule inner protein 1 C-terminal domain-containing protein n=1 Tax=Chrysodeixis includens TaxID=689277 RepID=A0A9P0FRD3_CHRIL|nr:unnamed protein product [Chrysodeixis includens]